MKERPCIKNKKKRKNFTINSFTKGIFEYTNASPCTAIQRVEDAYGAAVLAEAREQSSFLVLCQLHSYESVSVGDNYFRVKCGLSTKR